MPTDPAADLKTDTLLDELTALASRAAAEILRVRQGAIGARMKADASPVTLADEASEALLLDGLARILPGVPVISEEATARGGAVYVDTTFVLVDPLDGTREFVAGRDEFTINIALIHARRPVAGLLAAPLRGRIWRAAAGRGASVVHVAAGEAPGKTTAVEPVRCRAWPAQPVALVSRSHLDANTEGFLATCTPARVLACGSALKFALIAQGEADIYPRLAPTREWDIAAGDAIVAAGGGCVVDPQGEPLLYGGAERDFGVPGFIAWGDAARAGKAA
ncbi:MAG: 3'(2'),5'-bisphosphate nucleotidase CysQ [Pseudorhodoplanes sp.]|nr:3'(2'),5'-bisphosphate nucleotidase CysQ [Pseudorhodoplanes sp.]MBW7949262.1 3'(2'),5'-bisphosphate nucleotidase CysQ [Pseudorhodoplanes sp.]